MPSFSIKDLAKIIDTGSGPLLSGRILKNDFNERDIMQARNYYTGRG